MTFLFARRYFKAKKSTNAINIISWISVVAIMVVSGALIVVFSVFNGFEDLVKSLYTDFYADIRVAPAKGKVITASPQILKQIKSVSGVLQVSLVAEEQALLMNGDYKTIVYVKGVDENYKNINALTNHIVAGSFDVGSTEKPKLVVGGGIENAVGIDVVRGLNPVTLYLPNKQAANFNSIDGLNSYNVQPSGTFMVQQEFDNKYAFTDLGFLQYMLSMKPDECSAIEIKTSPKADADKIKKQIASLLGKDVDVQTRYEQNKSLFTAMQIEKWFIYGITTLILIVASFNIIGALTMLVLEKQKDINVLKAMGASDSMIQKIFLNEGFMLAGIGAVSGIGIATVICLLQIKFKFIKLTGGTFIIDYYPVKLLASDFILVIVTIVIIALLAAYIPARKAGKQIFSLK
ncbi:FtsX-like permease family protein [Chitinophagaceae bacterium LWZ2-11]